MTTENYLPKIRGGTLWLRRFSRISALALLLTVVLLLFSGWGITQTGVIYKITFGLIDRGIANNIHRATNLPLAIFFLSHVMINIRLMISRDRPSTVWPVNIILILVGLGLIVIVIYMEYFRLGG